MTDAAKLSAQALVAVTGLWPRGAPTVRDLLAAEALPDQWRKVIRRWLKGEQAPWTWEPPPPDQSKFHDKVLAPLDVDAVTGWLTALGDPEIGAIYADTIRNAREYIDAQWPKLEIGSVVPETLPLSVDDMAEVWGITRALDAPDSVLADLESWTLTASQMAAWRAVMPELASMVDQIMTAELVEHVAQKRPLSWQLEDLIRVFRGLPPEAKIEVAGAEEAKPEPQPTKVTIDFAATRTPSQAAMAGSR
jgi:hypothetical protein